MKIGDAKPIKKVYSNRRWIKNFYLIVAAIILGSPFWSAFLFFLIKRHDESMDLFFQAFWFAYAFFIFPLLVFISVPFIYLFLREQRMRINLYEQGLEYIYSTLMRKRSVFLLWEELDFFRFDYIRVNNPRSFFDSRVILYELGRGDQRIRFHTLIANSWSLKNKGQFCVIPSSLNPDYLGLTVNEVERDELVAEVFKYSNKTLEEKKNFVILNA